MKETETDIKRIKLLTHILESTFELGKYVLHEMEAMRDIHSYEEKEIKKVYNAFLVFILSVGEIVLHERDLFKARFKKEAKEDKSTKL
jgi:hypothetical protein